MEKIQEITQRNQKERFGNLSEDARNHFFNSLIKEDNLGEEQARRVYDLFESGEAGSVSEALKLLREDEKKDSYTHR